MRIIDLSQEIFVGMPVFNGHPPVNIEPAQTHEQRAGIENPTTISPVVNKMVFGEHTGTHVDVFNHFGAEYREQSIDTMPLWRAKNCGVWYGNALTGSAQGVK